MLGYLMENYFLFFLCLFQKALEELMRDKTIFIIAHRLSTIRNADEIICVDNGAIAEKGTHFELMKKNGIYKKLIEKQLIKPSADDIIELASTA